MRVNVTDSLGRVWSAMIPTADKPITKIVYNNIETSWKAVIWPDGVYEAVNTGNTDMCAVGAKLVSNALNLMRVSD